MSSVSADGPPDRLGAPDPGREPLRVNVYEQVRAANTELVPLFPYLGPGAIVPAGALMMGTDDGDHGRFFHRNSQEEVVVCWGAHDDFFQAGLMAVNGKMHEVKAMITNPEDPESFMLGVITQRQADDGDQRESVTFRCLSCNEKQYQHSFDASVVQGTEAAAVPYPTFATIDGSLAAAEGYNDEVAGKPCAKCGEIAPRFPTELWGWGEWVRRNAFVNEARAGLDDAARQLLDQAATR